MTELIVKRCRAFYFIFETPVWEFHLISRLNWTKELFFFLAQARKQEHKRRTNCAWKETKDFSVYWERTTEIIKRIVSNEWDFNNWELTWHGQRKCNHYWQKKAIAAKGLDSAIYEHLHTNNKPRRQTNPLTTRCDTTKIGSPLCHYRGQRSSSRPLLTPACTQHINIYDLTLFYLTNGLYFSLQMENRIKLSVWWFVEPSIFGAQWTTRNVETKG